MALQGSRELARLVRPDQQRGGRCLGPLRTTPDHWEPVLEAIDASTMRREVALQPGQPPRDAGQMLLDRREPHLYLAPSLRQMREVRLKAAENHADPAFGRLKHQFNPR
jgi:hypothetical protein